MRAIAFAAAVAAVVTMSARADEIWRPAQQQCAAQLTAHVNCGSCFALWPAIANCAVHKVAPAIPQARIDECISAVNTRDYNLPQGIKRTPDVFKCLGL